MGEAESRRPKYRFGSFELETQRGELRKGGTRVRLQEQPLQILVLLLEHAGEVVTREQIQDKLWPPGTYVDYDNAINGAMRKLREALCDDSGDPRFIETFAQGISIHRRHRGAASTRAGDSNTPSAEMAMGSDRRTVRRNRSCGSRGGLVAAGGAPGAKDGSAEARAAYCRVRVGVPAESLT